MSENTNTNDLLRTALKEPSENVARSVLSAAGVNPDEIQRTISTGTGLVAYDLQAPAKNLYPVVTPIRNRLPRVGGGVGTATNWRQVNAILGSGFDATGWVPEGQRAGRMSYNTSTRSAPYATIGEEDAATFEAIHAGRTFEDVRATMSMRLLQKMMLKEEILLLGGNATLALGTPTAPVVAASGSGSSLAATTLSVKVAALTLEGVRNSSLSGGVATTKTIAGADGQSFTLNGGSSNISAATALDVTGGQVLTASVTPIQGALGYAWYVGAAGSEVLQAITSINSVSISALMTGTQAAAAITADNSLNSSGFDGLMTAALKAPNGAYVKMLDTGTAGKGTSLTASGRGSVNEIDDMLQTMWDQYQVSPSVLYVGSQVLKDVTGKVFQGSSNSSLLNYFRDPNTAEYRATAGGTIEFYFNPFHIGAGQRIPVKIHPYLPAGTIIGWAEDLPLQYQNNEVPNVAEVKTRNDYYQIDWPVTTRQRQVGVYAEETLAVYAPFAMGVISNIAAG